MYKESRNIGIITIAVYAIFYYIFGESKEVAILAGIFFLVINIVYDLIWMKKDIKILREHSAELKEHIDQRLNVAIEVLGNKINPTK